jgi:hypothetical protein
MARVHGGRVRALAWDAPCPSEAHAPDGPLDLAAERLDERSSPTLEERWWWFREEVGMMTFFLLDPESWR